MNLGQGKGVKTMLMSWIAQYLEALRLGANAFLFVGAVSDGYPRILDPESKDPIDMLESWAEVMARVNVPKEGESLIWTFDLVRGFTFAGEEQEKKFRDILVPPKEKKSADPIAAAKQEMKEKAPLPNNPVEALQVMRLVMQQTAKQKDGPRCVAVIPDLDTICGMSGPGADKSAMLVALILRDMATDYSIKSRHLLLCSTPALKSLDERMRRPDMPMKIIDVRKPDEEARAYLLQNITGDGGIADLHRQKQDLQARLARAAEIAVEEAQAEAVSLEAELAQVRAQQRAEFAEMPGVSELQAEIDTVRLALRKLEERDRRNSEVQIASLERQRKQLSEKLLKDPAVVSAQLDKDSWKRIKEGDILQFPEIEGGDLVVLKRLWHVSASEVSRTFQCDGIHSVWLSEPGKTDTPIKEPNGREVLFIFRAGRMYAYSLSNQQKKVLPEQQTRVLTKARQDMLQRVSVLDEQLRLHRAGKSKSKEHMQSELLLAGLNIKMRDLKAALRKQNEEENTQLQVKIFAVKESLRKDEVVSAVVLDLQKQIDDLNARIDALDKRVLYPLPAMGIPVLARLTQGLGYRDLIELMETALRRCNELAEADVVQMRLAILQKAYGHLVEVVDPSYGFDGIAGLDGIKEFLSDVRKAIHLGDMRAVPMGCLLMGPPGTGKTAIAEAFAKECGFLFVKVKNMRAMWVGESERQMEELMGALKDLAPVVVLRDEVDEEDSGRDSFQGDSGVSGRLRQMWMTMLSDPKIRGKIFVISCTNRPDRMDPALKRSGRTDERIPVLMPDAATREALFAVMARRYGYPSKVESYAGFAAQTENLSGADIEVIVRHAFEFAVFAGKAAIDEMSLTHAIEDFIPSASQEQIARMTLLAIQETSGRRFYPPNMDEIVKRAVALEQNMQQREKQQRELAAVAVPIPVGGKPPYEPDPSESN
ncbi:MAG: AAA family ATPase [Patescibacteria group bacterium]